MKKTEQKDSFFSQPTKSETVFCDLFATAGLFLGWGAKASAADHVLKNIQTTGIFTYDFGEKGPGTYALRTHNLVATNPSHAPDTVVYIYDLFPATKQTFQRHPQHPLVRALSTFPISRLTTREKHICFFLRRAQTYSRQRMLAFGASPLSEQTYDGNSSKTPMDRSKRLTSPPLSFTPHVGQMATRSPPTRGI